MLGGSLDVAFIGSSPAINAFAKSNGEAVRLIAGAASGGAQLVVSKDITSPEQLKGKTIATPQLGNTQDVSLKKWLKANNLEIATAPDPNKVVVQNLDNPRTLDLFKSGQIAGGWLPEPLRLAGSDGVGDVHDEADSEDDALPAFLADGVDEDEEAAEDSDEDDEPMIAAE